jgi:hypothetical protein
MKPEISEIAQWMEKQTLRDDYGEIHVVLKIDRGRVAFVERSFVEKLKFTGPSGGAYETHKK